MTKIWTSWQIKWQLIWWQIEQTINMIEKMTNIMTEFSMYFPTTEYALCQQNMSNASQMSRCTYDIHVEKLIWANAHGCGMCICSLRKWTWWKMHMLDWNPVVAMNFFIQWSLIDWKVGKLCLHLISNSCRTIVCKKCHRKSAIKLKISWISVIEIWITWLQFKLKFLIVQKVIIFECEML